MSEKLAYLAGLGMTNPEAIEEFLEVTRMMDRAYIAWARAQAR